MASLLALLSLLFPLLLSGAAVYGATLAYRREWQGTWRGHRVLVQNYLNEELLYIDGKLLARGGNGWAKFESTLTGEVEGQPVMAVIKPSRMLTAVSAEVYIGGVAIPLEEAAAGTFENSDSTHATASRDPADPRWNALVRLVEQISGVAPDQAELGQTAKRQIRALLTELEDLAEAAEAHEVLDSSGAGVDGVVKLLAVREANVQQLLYAVQALHLSAMAGRAEPDTLRDLMARLEVEVETSPPRAQQAARARQLER